VRRGLGTIFGVACAVTIAHQPRGEAELKALVARMGLTGSIRFRGQMPLAALAKEFANADMGLQTSLFAPEVGQAEGVPNIILEAMAMACR